MLESAGLKELLGLLGGLVEEGQEGWHGEVTSVEVARGALTLGFEFHLMENDTSAENDVSMWLLRASGVRAQRLAVLGPFARAEMVRDHPILWNEEARGVLGFRGGVPSIARVLGELWVAHDLAVGRWLPFFVDREILGMGFGNVARGPTRLLRVYEAVLARHGLQPSVVEHWARTLNERSPSGFLLDESYVVAERFDAEHVTSSRG
jgi:hypothetical protein